MPLNKLTFKSGIVSDITPYSNEGGVVDGDKVDFVLVFQKSLVVGKNIVLINI